MVATTPVPGCKEGDNYERGFREIPVSSCRAAEQRHELASSHDSVSDHGDRTRAGITMTI
jgi:hypothetical protein